MPKTKEKTVLIVESPTKARTISRFLDASYSVTSSYGHIRDLPSSKLGIDTENNFAPQYVIPRKKSKTVKELKAEIKNSNHIILATDEDREGEAIAWHLTHALGLIDNGEKKIERIVFHEITKRAIEEALKSPRSLDIHLIDAQQARRVLDRLVGYKLSPFLWKKVMRGLSAGRVQSVALRLIVEREREREKFKKEEYWSIHATFETEHNETFSGDLVSFNKKPLEKFSIRAEKEAKKIKEALSKDLWRVVQVESKRQERSPLAPFTTSTLQQTASQRLRMTAKQTMMLAQQLYEGVELRDSSLGLITYMRTDSTNVSKESQNAARTFIEKEFGKKYALQNPRIFKHKSKGAQEAHEAIRPTHVTLTPDSIKTHLDARQYKLYDLIWRRFTASQMSNGIFDLTSIDIEGSGNEKALFRATGQITAFDGFLKVWHTKSQETSLPSLKENELLTLNEISPIQHFTEPPPRYSEALLVKTLEKNGIGRPSTYAPTMSTIVDRGYVAKDEHRKFYPTEMGTTVNDILVEHFPEIVDIDFTAKMEEDLDHIAEGKMQWVPVIKEFYEPFARHLEEKYESVEKKDMTEETGEACDKCGKPLIIRHGRFGKFIACSGFPDCRNTKTLPPKTLGIPCPDCKEGEYVEKRTRTRRLFYGCSRYPDCTHASWKRPNQEKENVESD